MEQLKQQGMTEEEAKETFAEMNNTMKEAIAVDEAKGPDMATPEYVETVGENQLRMSRINLAKSLKKAGYSNEGIAKYMGLAESSVRELLK